MSAPQLIIFDCDGVLVDTEGPSNQVLAQLISESGWALTPEGTSHLFTGWRMDDVIARVERQLNRTLPEGWLDEFEARRYAAFDKGIHAIPGIASVLEHLSKLHIRFCVGSSGSIAKMRYTLTQTGLRPYFPDDVLFSARTLPRGKPFPDVFLHAAEKMGAAPSHCIVVEDSLPGAKAAQAAGMRCLAYTVQSDSTPFAAVGAVCFADMRQLPPLLGL